MQQQELKNLYVYLDRLQWELERVGAAQFLFGTSEGVHEAYDNLLGIQRTTALTITELTRCVERILPLVK